MGNGGWDSQAWGAFKTANVSGKSRAQIFTSHGLNEAVDPTKFTNGIRESVDGPDNPNSTPVAIFTDATGSMGDLAHIIVSKLDVICQELIDRKPVSDVHLMTGLIGDGYTDTAPFQATQFEADIRIADQTKLLWLGGCSGGGNHGESYALPWLSMAMQTVTDSFDKRGKKGYLFTVGDEGIHGVTGGNGETYGVTVDQAKRLLNLDIERDLTAEEIYAMVSRRWHVYHIVVGGGSGTYRNDVEKSFGKLMPDRLIWLEGNNVDLLPELIVSTVEVNEGKDKAAVAASWGGDKSLVVANAMRSMVVAGDDGDGSTGVVRL